MGSGADGVSAGRGHWARRAAEGIAEVWRERSSEKRARATAKLGPEPRLRRSRLAAAIEARLAVRSGVRLDDFLRQRLAKYAGRLPVPLEALPVTVDIEAGEAVVRQRPPPRAGAYAARPAAPAFARALVDRDGLYAARELRDAEDALDRLDARALAARARLDELELELEQALSCGQVIAAPQVEATAEQLGRPPVPSALPVHALRAAAAGLVAAEAWRFAGPIAAASGAAPDGLERALHTAPLPAALAIAFAAGIAASTVTFAAAALAWTAEGFAAAPASTRRGLQCAAAAVAVLVVPGVAAAGAAPHGWAQLALLAAVPFTAAMLWRAAGALSARRGVAADAALAWDRERAREAIERGRREEVRARAAAELGDIDAERSAARRKLQRLHRLAVAAERSAMLSERAETRGLDRLSESLACALELDRYLYVRLAASGAAAYERPIRAARLEPAVAPERLGVAG
jgi:hypothetical protein